jgi:S1-C subfamily serine protease
MDFSHITMLVAFRTSMKHFTLPVISLLALLILCPKVNAENPKPSDRVLKITTKIEYLDEGAQITKNTKPIIVVGGGSGVIYDKYIITNNHVIRGFKTVTFEKDSSEVVEAKFLGTSFCDDIAVFKLTNKKNYATNNFKANFTKGETLISFGYAKDAKLDSISGKIASIYAEIDDSNQVNLGVIKLNNEIKLGFSGGGVFDTHGTLVGINQSVVLTQKTSYIIPFYRVRKLISDFEAKRYVFSGGLSGVSVYSSPIKKYGVIITALTPYNLDSNIHIGDIITEIDGRELKPYSPYTTFCNTLPMNRPLALNNLILPTQVVRY